MKIKSLSIKNFRNYQDNSFNFDPKINVILGPNGIGKTNILEAIYVLTHGKSWKSQYDLDLINHDAEVANIKANISRENKEQDELFVGIQKGMGNRSQKTYKVNNVSKSLSTFSRSLNSVLFSPQDLEIIIGSPSKRRHFLNESLSQTDEKYAKEILKLKKIVTARNRLLKRINEGISGYNELEYWNQQLIESSNYIHEKRKIFITQINEFIGEKFSLIYNSNAVAKITYDHSIASEQRLQEYKIAEIASKRTLVGAQKDDLLIELKKIDRFTDARYFASRGEQRTLVLVLKLASLKYIQQKLKIKIILLLDDIYSELDETHRSAIAEYFNENQVIITTAEKDLIPQNILSNSRMLNLEKKRVI